MLLLCVTAVLFCSCGDEKDEEDDKTESEKTENTFTKAVDEFVNQDEEYPEEEEKIAQIKSMHISGNDATYGEALTALCDETEWDYEPDPEDSGNWTVTFYGTNATLDLTNEGIDARYVKRPLEMEFKVTNDSAVNITITIDDDTLTDDAKSVALNEIAKAADEETSQMEQDAELEEKLAEAKEIYLDYWNNAELTGEFVFTDLTGDGIPEIIYNAVGYGETAILYIDEDGDVQENLEFNVRMINIEEGTFYCAWYNAYYTSIYIITYDEMDAREEEHTFFANMRDGVDWNLYDDDEYMNPYNANIYQYYTDDVEYDTYDEAYEEFESYRDAYNLILTDDVDWYAEETFAEELEAYGR